MHLRGKAFRFEAIYPDGREEILLDVPRYDFSWQNTYDLAEPKPMPAGTEIVCTARFDNSADNPVESRPDGRGDLGRSDLARDGGRHDERQLRWSRICRSARRRSRPWATASTKRSFPIEPTRKSRRSTWPASFNDWKPDGQRMDGPDAEGRYTAKRRSSSPATISTSSCSTANTGGPIRAIPPMPVSIRTACCTSATERSQPPGSSQPIAGVQPGLSPP